MPNVEVILAEQKLEAARKRQRAEQRAQQVTQLKAVRKELATKNKAYDALARKIGKDIEGKGDLEREISHWRQELDAMEQRAPIAVKIPELSDDPDAIEHKKQYDALCKKIERLCEKRQQFFWIASGRIDAVNLANAIKSLQASESNLLRALTGELERTSEASGTVRHVA